MDKTLSSTFLAALNVGGAAIQCLHAIRAKYDLWLFPRNKPLHPTWQEYYSVELPKTVMEQTDGFDFWLLESGASNPLLEEITANLDEIGTDKERQKRYISGLLSPLKGWARVVNTKGDISRLRAEIEDYKAIEAEGQQVEACNDMIDRRQQDIGRLQYIGEKINSMIGRVYEYGTIEYCLNLWYRAVIDYSTIVDAALLMHGLDLMEYQQLTGVYLMEQRDTNRVARYVGTVELTRHYMQALKGQERKPQQQTKACDKVMTGRAKEYFAKALKMGLMEETADGYKWLLNNASLGYFLKQIYNPDGFTAIPYKALESLFGVIKLAKSLDQALMAEKPQKWRERIDKLFAD